MKFIILLALFATAANAGVVRDEKDRFLLDIIAGILEHLNPVDVGPAIVDIPAPVVVPEPVIPTPIDPSPVIVVPSPQPEATPAAPAPPPPFPFNLNGPLVQLVLNINQGHSAGNPVVIEGAPVIIEETAPIAPSPVIVVDSQPEPITVVNPILPSPVITLPGILN